MYKLRSVRYLLGIVAAFEHSTGGRLSITLEAKVLLDMRDGMLGQTGVNIRRQWSGATGSLGCSNEQRPGPLAAK